jgi:hypothetical protein
MNLKGLKNRFKGKKLTNDKRYGAKVVATEDRKNIRIE